MVRDRVGALFKDHPRADGEKGGEHLKEHYTVGFWGV